MRSNLEIALDTAKRGWPVFPVQARGKAPLTPHGFRDATTAHDQITAWWSRWPDANIAITTGHPGPTVIDVDDLAHPDAVEVMARLDRDRTPYVTTGRGRHYYFKGGQEPTIVLTFGEQRGAGGYVIAPGSTHANGNRYEWASGQRATFVPAPGWLFDYRKSQGIGRGAPPPFEPVPPGGMHEFLADRALRLLQAGITSARELEVILLAEFAAVRQPGVAYAGDERDTIRLARWASNTEIAQREREDRGQPSTNPQPLDHHGSPPTGVDEVVVRTTTSAEPRADGGGGATGLMRAPVRKGRGRR